MGFDVKITSLPASLNGSGRLGELDERKDDVLLEGGKALQTLLQEWMSQLGSASRHSPPHWNPDDVLEPVVDESSVTVPITTPGITRALHDIVIQPVHAKALAIPVNEAVYGISPKNYTAHKLFIPKGKNYLAMSEGGKLTVMYLLKDSVHQSQDRNLFPSNEAMNNAIMTAIHGAVETILEGRR